MKRRKISWLLVLGVALLLVGCATVPMQSGKDLLDVRTVKPQSPYTVVEIDTNPAAAIAEPYPSILVLIWKPAAMPEKIKTLEKEVQDLSRRIGKADRNSPEFKSLQNDYQRTNKKYSEARQAWLATAKPEDELKNPNGEYYRAVGIDFKNGEGKVVETCRDGKIVVDAKTIMTIEPWYGGKKRVVITKSLKELADNGYKIAVPTNDDSQAKRVFRLDGKGVMGEKWGTAYPAFNRQVHGERFVYDNPRMFEVIPGSDKDKAIQIWNKEMIKKAAIVGIKSDVTEFGLPPGLEEFEGMAGDPFIIRHIVRKTSRMEALRQAVGNWDFALNPTLVYNWQDAAFSLGVSVSTKIIQALFAPRHFFIYGSAGTPVTRYDWAVSRLESSFTDEAIQKMRERNVKAKEYNELGIEIENETNPEKRAEMQKKYLELGKEYLRLIGYKP